MNTVTMRLATFAMAFMAIPLSAIANSYTLKCTTDRGEPAADLTVDLDRKVMSRGMRTPNYIITNITERYITAIENNDVMGETVGGEVWVLDRVTGDYKRAIVGIVCAENPCLSGYHLRAFTLLGRCVRPML